MNGYFDNNKYENFASKPTATTKPTSGNAINSAVDTSIQRINQAGDKILGQINNANTAKVNQVANAAISQVNKSANTASQAIGQEFKTQYNNAKKYVPKIAKDSINTALKNADPIAKELVHDVTGAFNYGKTYYNKNADPMIKKGFKTLESGIKKIPGNKKASSMIFLIFVAIVILTVFAIYYFKYSGSYISNLIEEIKSETPKPASYMSGILKNLVFVAIICGMIVLSFIIFKAVVLKADVKKKDSMNILMSVITIGIPVLIITMATIGNMPLMLRSFENTFGYWWINGSSLKECTTKLFDNGNYNDYNIVATQLFEENFNYYLKCMNQNYKGAEDTINLNRFKNVYLKPDFFDEEKLKIENSDENELYKLLKLVIRKRHISEATWISLAAVFVMYSSYLYIE